MTSWSERPAGRIKRPAGIFCAWALAAGLGAMATPVSAAAQDMSIVAAGGMDQFYRQRGGEPLWLTAQGGDAAIELMTLLDSAPLDGIDPAQLRVEPLRRALRTARSSYEAAMRADAMLSSAFIAYVRALRSVDPAATGWTINDRELRPQAPSAGQILAEAAAAGSLTDYVRRMGWMHSSYSELRRALVIAEREGDARQAQILHANLQRTRLLPGENVRRYVLVNTAAQRLDMVENGRVVDSMKVVVGKPAQPTPMMAAMIRYTAVNPYWNLPADLVAERVAPNVLKEGLGYLDKQGYTILSDWTDQATRVDPAGINWAEVAAGKVELRARQAPGPANAMGTMKFMFPNAAGVYLHDTPNKELLGEDARLFSAGCVRLEAAPRLAEWLYGKPLQPEGAKPEQRIDLDAPVPVYLAYLTAVPQSGVVVYFEDVYNRDRTALALARR